MTTFYTVSCSSDSDNADDQTLLILMLLAAQQQNSQSATTCSTTIISPTVISCGSVAPVSYKIAKANLCYWKFTNTTGGLANFRFVNTVSSGDSDIAIDDTTFQTSPTNGSFWTTGTPCGDGSGWDICIATTASPENASFNNVPNGSVVYASIWGFAESSDFTFGVTQF